MLVNDLMTGKVLSVKADMDFSQVCETFFQMGFTHLPVTDDKQKLIGIISAQDALRAFHDTFFNAMPQTESVNDLIRIRDIMSTDLKFLHSDDTISRALILFKEFNIHAIPVIENNELIGILTSNDILNALDDLQIEVTGI